MTVQIVGLIIIGMVISLLARLVLPRRQRIGVGLTVLLGIAGAQRMPLLERASSSGAGWKWTSFASARAIGQPS
jgi:uncharacterized membrane protein YeaQ/YmgE (transglycosylase-associated protein family)